MSVDVCPERFMPFPPERVASVMFDPAQDATWTSGVVSSRALQAGALAPGHRVERTTRFLGRTFSYTYEARAVEPGRRAELLVERPFPMRITYTIEAVAGGSRVAIRAAGDPGRFFALVGPLMSRMVYRNIALDLENLERVVGHAEDATTGR